MTWSGAGDLARWPPDPQETADEIARRYGITQHVACTLMWHLGLWQEGDQSYPPSEWRSQLYKIIDKSDPPNLARIALGFPAEVAAHQLVKGMPNGAALVRAIANTPEASHG